MDRRFEFTRRSTSRVLIGDGIEPDFAGALSTVAADGCVFLHDRACGRLAARLARACRAKAIVPIADGEAAKSLDGIAHLARELGNAGATRTTALVALGGGSVTDTVGFLASIYLRGVPLVHCPTTTLAMCDAALGGKNGINHGGLKNRLGTIRQPDLVFADIDWLQSLPDELFREGLVEVVKKAALLDAGHFVRLESIAADLVARRAAATLQAVEMAVAMKMDVVLSDETDVGRRHALNFGHTIGHAIESLSARSLRHGSCVAMGLVAECRAAGSAVPAAVTARIGALLAALGVATAVPRDLADAERLWQLAQKDKKVRRGEVPMLVPSAIGAGVEVQLTAARLAAALA